MPKLDAWLAQVFDAGGPTATIVSLMAEVEAERLAAERELGQTVPKEPLSPSQIKAIVASLTDHLRVLAEADPATKSHPLRQPRDHPHIPPRPRSRRRSRLIPCT